MKFLIILAIIIVIIIYYIYNMSLLEGFSDTENRTVYNLFKDTMTSNGTFHEFNQRLNKNKVMFSENNEWFGTNPHRKSMNFNQYMEMLKKYNKGTLDVSAIDRIRQA